MHQLRERPGESQERLKSTLLLTHSSAVISHNIISFALYFDISTSHRRVHQVATRALRATTALLLASRR